jgi:hypothetical protein
MLLLSVIIEYFQFDEIKTYYEQLNVIIEEYLKSSEPSLKKLAIETVNKLSSTPKAIKILKQYKNLVPLVLQALDLSEEDMIQKVFETLNEFLEIKKVLTPHLQPLIEAALRISTDADLSLNLRESTLYFLSTLADNYSKYIVKKGGVALIEKIIEGGCKILSEPEDVISPDEDTVQVIALDMLYAFACEVPNEIVYPIFHKYIVQLG